MEGEAVTSGPLTATTLAHRERDPTMIRTSLLLALLLADGKPAAPDSAGAEAKH